MQNKIVITKREPMHWVIERCSVCTKDTIGPAEYNNQIPIENSPIGRICYFCKNSVHSTFVRSDWSNRKKWNCVPPESSEFENQLYHLEYLANFLNKLAYKMLVHKASANHILDRWAGRIK